MSHLSRDRVLDAVEERGTPETTRHLATCPRCRAEVEGLRRALQDVRAVEVPEPSPLFWQHLSGRVHEAIAREPIPEARAAVLTWWSGRSLRPVLAVATVVMVAALMDVLVVPPAGRNRPAPLRTAAPPVLELRGGADWQFIVDVAATVDWPRAGDIGSGMRPGSSDLAVSALSPDEQRELVKLLTEEVGPAPVEAPPTGKGDV